MEKERNYPKEVKKIIYFLYEVIFFPQIFGHAFSYLYITGHLARSNVCCKGNCLSHAAQPKIATGCYIYSNDAWLNSTVTLHCGG